jgi:amino acid permease
MGTGISAFAFLLVGSFGYITFAGNKDVDNIMKAQNILLAEPYENSIVIKISTILILFVVFTCSPFNYLPCKDSIEEMFLGNRRKLTSKENVLLTFLLITISYIIAILVPGFGDAVTILGATTNSAIGWLLPIIYFLKMNRKKRNFSNKRYLAYACFIFIILSSIIELGTFIYKKVNNISE